ncbi:MAG: RNA polymerase sigma factor [Salinivirgaceae bacterium]|nr:RNA polymerase sigma factor [Salinivirgaceae bacterium]
MILESNYVDINSQLIDECRSGSSKAQFEVYKLYYKAMYNTCLRFVRDPMEAEDIMQEAFLSAFRNIDSFRGEVSFGSWLKRIVVNRSLDALRKRKLDLDPLEEGRTVVDTDCYDGDEVDFKVGQVKMAIGSLPDSYRTLLTLHLIEGYDHEEIAQITGLSNAAVRTGYSRARKKLQELLETKKFEIWMS